MSPARLTFVLIGCVAAAIHWWTRLPIAPRRRGAGTARARSGAIEAVTKVLATVAAIGVAAASGAPADRRIVVVVALVLCLAGDIALLASVDRFVIGLGAFLLAHVVFVVAFVRDGLHPGWRTTVALVACGIVIATVGRRILRGARGHDAALAMPVGAYLATISTMAVVGWATRSPWVWLGATSFVVSDAVLGWEEFVERRPLMPVAVMTTYHLAIFALALGL